jgi:hypothetical protein
MRKTLITLFASLVVHAAPLALVQLPVASARAPAPPPSAEPVDRWTGTTAEIGGARIYDVSVDAPGAGHAGAPALATPAPTPPSSPRAEDAPKEPAPPKPSPPPGRRQRAPEVAPDAPRAAEDAPARRPSGEAARRSEGGGAAEDSGGGPRAGSFGAEGPSAVRDLGRAFTRAIPPACQADPTWGKLATGDGGAIEVAITVDETGHITGFKPPADDAPRHLVALVKRTLALLEAGTFAIRSGSVSAGTEVLRIRASLRDVDESELGGAAGLSFAYERGKGKAGFTQPGGRHVEVSVEVVRVEGGAKP